MSWFLPLMIAGGAACADQKGPPPPPPPREIDVITLQPREVRETGEYLGSLFSRDSVNVVPQVSGYVRKISVKPGDRVKAGQALMEIDSREETASLESGKAQLESAKARRELARQTLLRSQALNKEGLAASEEVERSRADMEASEASLRVAESEVTARQVRLQYHVIAAAVSGVVSDIPVRVGDSVNTNTHLTSIAQQDVLELSVQVPAARARDIRPDAPIEILDEEGGVLLSSRVFFVAPEADPRTQLVEVKSAFQNAAGLRPSELVRARLIYGVRNALELPALAVVRQSGQPFAFVVFEKEGKLIVERRPVKLGALGDKAYVVESGLRDGERIAVSSLQMLRDGAAVKIKGEAPAKLEPAGPASAGK